MTNYAFDEQKKYVQQVEALADQFRAATGQRSPTADRVRGALYAYIAPRLGQDERVRPDDLDDATAGLDRSNFRARRAHVADRVRKMTRGRGRLGRDVDLSDLEALLGGLEREEGGEEDNTSYDSRRRHGRDEERGVTEPGMSRALDPSQHPFSESEAEDAELEELKTQMSPEAYDRLRRRAADRRRRARDSEESPYESLDQRRRVGRDDPMFPGAPRTGGGQYPMENESVDRPGMGEPRDVGAKDRARRYGARPRRMGADAAPRGFSDRFKFTNSVSNTTSAAPIKIAVG
jgi:hypothetical protein